MIEAGQEGYAFELSARMRTGPERALSFFARGCRAGKPPGGFGESVACIPRREAAYLVARNARASRRSCFTTRLSRFVKAIVVLSTTFAIPTTPMIAVILM